MSYNYDLNPWDDNYNAAGYAGSQQPQQQSQPPATGYGNGGAGGYAGDGFGFQSQQQQPEDALGGYQQQDDQQQVPQQQQAAGDQPQDSPNAPQKEPHSAPFAGSEFLRGTKIPFIDALVQNVNRDLLVSKMFYFFFYSAFGSLFPLMGVYFKQLGMNPAQVGVLTGVRPFIEIFSAPFWHSLAERLHKSKVLLIFSLISWIVFTLSLAFIRPPASACIAFNDTDYILYTPYSSHELSNTIPEFESDANETAIGSSLPNSGVEGQFREGKDQILASEENQNDQRRRRRQVDLGDNADNEVDGEGDDDDDVDTSANSNVNRWIQSSQPDLGLDPESDFEDSPVDPSSSSSSSSRDRQGALEHDTFFEPPADGARAKSVLEGDEPADEWSDQQLGAARMGAARRRRLVKRSPAGARSKEDQFNENDESLESDDSGERARQPPEGGFKTTKTKGKLQEAENDEESGSDDESSAGTRNDDDDDKDYFVPASGKKQDRPRQQPKQQSNRRTSSSQGGGGGGGDEGGDYEDDNGDEQLDTKSAAATAAATGATFTASTSASTTSTTTTTTTAPTTQATTTADETKQLDENGATAAAAAAAGKTKRIYRQRHKTPPHHTVGMSPITVEYAANYRKDKHSQWVTPMFSTIVYRLDNVKEVFFLLLLLICLGEFFSAPALTLADSATLSYLGENTDLYGRQRMFGSVSWAITLLLVGMALDNATSIADHPCGPHIRERSYTVCFVIFSLLMACALMTATQFRFSYAQNAKGAETTAANQALVSTSENGKVVTTTVDEINASTAANVDDFYASTQPRSIFNTAPPVNEPPPNLKRQKEKFEFLDSVKSAVFAQRTRQLPEWVKVFRQFRNPLHLTYLFITWFLGCGVGLVFTFLFWHLQETGGTPTLFGICSVINHISEILAYFFSFNFIKRFGHTKVLSVGLGCNVIRFIYVAFLTNPYYALPFELVQGITHAACFAACCSYISHVSKPELKNSTQGVMQGLHHGIGRACGTLLGGYMINAIGSRASFCIYGLLSGCVLAGFLHVRKKASEFADEEVKVDESEALGGYGAPQGVPSAIPGKMGTSATTVEPAQTATAQSYTDYQW